jgi:hypothetical protein
LQILTRRIIVAIEGEIVEHELNLLLCILSPVRNLFTPRSGDGSSEHVRVGVLFTNQVSLSCSLRQSNEELRLICTPDSSGASKLLFMSSFPYDRY